MVKLSGQEFTMIEDSISLKMDGVETLSPSTLKLLAYIYITMKRIAKSRQEEIPRRISAPNCWGCYQALKGTRCVYCDTLQEENQA